MSSLSATFWGVRGSVPSPGSATARYGGNTACVEVRAGETRIVLDMGSGLRALGEALRDAPVTATFLLSHYHWDHLQGLPFFAPAYDPRCAFDFYGSARGGRGVSELLASQMVEPFFPVSFDALRARLSFHTIESGSCFDIGPVRVTARALNHPNGVLGYRLESGGGTIVFASDTEHGAADDALVELSAGADLLIYDAMYTPNEYLGRPGPARGGWGHSTWEAAVRLAAAARVGELALFHHDPSRSDEALEEILAQARERWAATRLAREGETIELRVKG